MDDRSFFFGYEHISPGGLKYFDVECLLEDAIATEEVVCPSCYRHVYMRVVYSEEVGLDQSALEWFGVEYPIELLSLMCPECDMLVHPTGLMVKNETTNGIEEVERGTKG